MNVSSGYSLSNPQFVEANRRGEIDPGQRAGLERAAGWLAGCSGLVVTLVLLPAILVGVLVFVGYFTTGQIYE